jgi:hypothetical protein
MRSTATRLSIILMAATVLCVGSACAQTWYFDGYWMDGFNSERPRCGIWITSEAGGYSATYRCYGAGGGGDYVCTWAIDRVEGDKIYLKDGAGSGYLASGWISPTHHHVDYWGGPNGNGIIDAAGNNPAVGTPTANITSPAQSASFSSPANITITADAADSDGSVTKVTFYNGDSALGEDTNSADGWSYAWNGVWPGTHWLKARATDNEGYEGYSVPVGITVTGSVTTLNGIPYSWLAGYGIANTADSVETENPDGDAFNNLEEYLADTDPTNPDSFLKIETDPDTESGITISPCSSDRMYNIYSATEFPPTSWQVETNFAGTGGSITYGVNTDTARSGYFKAGVSLP